MAKFIPQGIVPQTPFYYYDLSLLRDTLKVATTEAKKYNYHLHYALKANVEPKILKIIKDAGLGADCVSGWEVKAAIENGFAPEKVVFAGVGKSDWEINYALENNIFCFNCESLEELEVLNQLALNQNQTATVALRINPNVEPKTHKYIATGQSESKFGIAYTEVDEVFKRLDTLKNINIVGLHFHIGSQILGLEYFGQLAARAVEICGWFEEKGMKIEHLNMGGGLGIDYDNPDKHLIPDFAEYFRQFAEHLPTDKTIHFELGRSIVAQCGELITRVLYTKKTAGDSNYIIVDAGMNDLIRPALYGAHHKIENLTARGEVRKMGQYYIGGPVCESSDVFAHDIEFVESERGDIISMRSAGAYGSIMSSHYNLRPTAPSYYGE